nr:unnamed protein product [Callosobruchus analis]
MVRTYKRKLGARIYKDYTNEVLDQALSKATEEGWSLQRASREYKIPYGTLNNKFHGRCIRKNGGQTVFPMSEEKVFISAAITCGEWGFPLEAADLRQFAKNCLDSQGRNIAIFTNNLLGNDWIDDIKNYFDNLRTTLQNIPPSNVFNFDETNVQDDPGNKKMLLRRGTKYPERVCNFTKSATIMMCGSASVRENVATGAENGSKGSPCCNKRCCALGARYNRTKHRWMDAQTFTDWFTSAFLPHAKELKGRKEIISSHFTNEVLQLCRENDIDFVSLPKNSTHLTQPLDVGFSRAFKTAWRSTLSKGEHDHYSSTTVNKKITNTYWTTL